MGEQKLEQRLGKGFRSLALGALIAASALGGCATTGQISKGPSPNVSNIEGIWQLGASGYGVSVQIEQEGDYYTGKLTDVWGINPKDSARIKGRIYEDGRIECDTYYLNTVVRHDGFLLENGRKFVCKSLGGQYTAIKIRDSLKQQ